MPETICEIHLRDMLDEKWAPYFAPFTMTINKNETILTGVVQDQSELFGVLWKVHDLGVTLLSLSAVRQ